MTARCKTVLVMYAHGGSVEKIAKRLHSPRRTVFRYLRAAAEHMGIDLTNNCAGKLRNLVIVLAGMGLLGEYEFLVKVMPG